MRSKKFLAVLLSCATLISSAMPVNAATLSFAKVSGKSVSSANYGYNYGTGGASTGTSIGVSKNNTGSSLSSSFGTIENTLKVLPPSSGLVASGFNSATFGTGTNLAPKKLPSSITLKQGKSYAFGYDYSKSRAGAVKWSVTNSKVLTGLVSLSYESQNNKKAVGKTCVTLKAAKKGACYLKLKVGAKTYKCRVRVTASGSRNHHHRYMLLRLNLLCIHTPHYWSGKMHFRSAFPDSLLFHIAAALLSRHPHILTLDFRLLLFFQ